jgi:hypothetical protein
VEVLFEPKEYKGLEHVARQRGEPVGAVIREAVARYVVGPSERKRQEAIRWLTSQQFDFDPGWDKVKQEIIQARVKAIEKSLETD